MPQLKKSSVNRSGVTARHWTFETNSVSYTVANDVKVRFVIASKGGGNTDIQLTIAPEDLRSIILGAAREMPQEIAPTLAEAAHIAIVAALKSNSKVGA